MRTTRYRCGECDQPLDWQAGTWHHRRPENHPPWPGRWQAGSVVSHDQTQPARPH